MEYEMLFNLGNFNLLKYIQFQGKDGKLYPVYVLDGDCYQLLQSSALRANFLVECLQDLDKNLRYKSVVFKSWLYKSAYEIRNMLLKL